MVEMLPISVKEVLRSRLLQLFPQRSVLAVPKAPLAGACSHSNTFSIPAPNHNINQILMEWWSKGTHQSRGITFLGYDLQ